MTVVFQAAGKLKQKNAEDIKQVFAAAAPLFESQPGFVRAELLASYSTLQVQILLYWDSFEAGAAFQRDGYRRLAKALGSCVEAQGTLVTSQLERSLGPAHH
jgi:heme-degrading monooxygenase HmoA